MAQSSLSTDLRKLLAFGSGVGVEIGARDLEVVVTRVRLNRVDVPGRAIIPNYDSRPAAEWGAEYAAFLKSAGAGHLSATVLLPRRDVIVRQVSLPGVAAKDVEGAIRLQLDTLHPYGDEEVSYGWSPLAYGAVLLGIVRRSTIDRYYTLFNEAGIAVGSFTFSAAAVHSAVRLNGRSGEGGFVAFSRNEAGAIEVYGESPARPVFSAELNAAPQRAVIAALSELRLPPDTPPLRFDEILPKPTVNPVENDLSRNALPYATALAGACPRLAPAANVLPAELRRNNSRAALIPTAVLLAILLLFRGGTLAWSSISERRYLGKVHEEIARIEPQALRAAALDRQLTQARARAQLLDQMRNQTRADLDTLNELTHLIEPPAWTSSVDLMRDQARITGEAPQAAPLLRILDLSSFFENSVPDVIQRSNSGSGEFFQIHTVRENRK